ncbi:MAG: ABC transporter ATP-binding protein [Kosmotoga sp.]|nr:MAG: ABC transporter ATP-binding protein [Kosmotoga sp.]
MLELDKVSKIYKTGAFGGEKLVAVNNVSFSLKDGEVASLIGESGSGKSTIGKMILKLISIESGTIKYNGKDINNLKGKDLKEYYRDVQGVFQDPFSTYNPIFKADRIFRIIREEFFPEISSKEWHEKVEKSLYDVGLNPGDVLNKFPHQLSGGQLQRFLIARALLLDVNFLVADEIISMLDASTRIDVLNLLAELKKRGLSVLFITHDLSLGYYISEKAIILYRGCVLESGITEKIFDNPLHPYTKMLMASVPRLDKKWEKVELELKAKQAETANKCVYYDRCPYAKKDEKCSNPEMIEAEEGHFVACCHYGEV